MNKKIIIKIDGSKQSVEKLKTQFEQLFNDVMDVEIVTTQEPSMSECMCIEYVLEITRKG